MSSLVIVAIPEQDDLVWKVSTEKVPHLTLMYLGEMQDVDHAGRMAEFVQHALKINEHGPFYLDVDYRGELGPDQADVLFFENGWDSKWIRSLRGQLLKQNDIRTAFESADQFPDWKPHLTLGYPDAPANPLPDDRKFYSVCFDRIAVWIGDYEGPEFRLKWPEYTEMEDVALAYSAADGEATIADILEHSGVKGMRWGHRKDNPGSIIEKPKNNLTKKQTAGLAAGIGVGAVGGASLTPGLPTIGAFAGAFGAVGLARTNKSVAKALDANKHQQAAYQKDKKWEKEFKKDKKYMDVHNDMADHMNSWLPGHNKKYDGVDLNKDPAKMKEYEDAYFKEQGDSFARSYSKIYGSSPSGKYKVSVIPGTNRVVLHDVRADPSAFKHAAVADEPLMTFAVTHEKTGRIIKVEPVTESIAQTSLLGEEHILEHFGVKGMRWGVRNEQIKAGAKAVGRGLAKAGVALADSDFETATSDSRARDSIETMAAAAFRRTDLPKIKAKPEYESASKLRNRMRHPRDPAAKAYRKEVKAAYIQRLEDAANKHTNASGTRQYTIRERGWELPEAGGALPSSRSFWEVSSRPIQHADSMLSPGAAHEFTVEVIMDDEGFVTDLQKTAPELTAEPVQTVHSALLHRVELGEQFIEHFGVKGMKWGQRKEQFRAGVHNRRVTAEATKRESRPAQDVRAYPTIGPKKRSKAKIDTKGGFDHPPTEDAIKVETHRQKMKKSGVKALSNKDLQEVATRLNLENQVHQLESKQPKSLGRKFVETLLGNSGGGGGGGGNKKDKKRTNLGGMAVKSLFKVAG